ncbi:TMEM175 family protein [Mucilaginibacter lappiensis]|uniref:Putative membrane protein n=1 Tax=Mucilaginibacter lappiensis TaxID=354630 RepID=A0A841JGX7_9SPHI|nr:TMEM175 family protein [Mucilaginibacter lappiensis]MBB6128846.1 putative membrane protein [Mucilaginibacter lappiensis]
MVNEDEIKKEFQLERVILFSDAVFAIIITIMVLEIKLPETLHHASAQQINQAFTELVPKFIGYALSFTLIGNFWYRHLQIFSFLKDYNVNLIVMNLIFLFFVSMFPFAVTFMTAGFDLIKYSWGLFSYIGIIFLVTLSQTVLVYYLLKNKRQLCVNAVNMETLLKWKVQRINFITIPLGFVCMVLIIWLKLDTKLFLYFVGLYGIVIATLNRKYYPDQNNSAPMLFRHLRSRRKTVTKPVKKGRIQK